MKKQITSNKQRNEDVNMFYENFLKLYNTDKEFLDYINKYAESTEKENIEELLELYKSFNEKKKRVPKVFSKSRKTYYY